MNIAIIGAGNGGQTMAAHFTYLGYRVKLYNRSFERLQAIANRGGIKLKGAIEAFVPFENISTNLQETIKDAELIIITTTADAHKDVAKQISKYIENNQIVVLSPGRTLGALEFYNTIKKESVKTPIVAEAQSLIYACRIEGEAEVNIIGIKDKVLLAAYPSVNNNVVLEKLNSIYPSFIEAPNVLTTSLENIGAILHPSVVLFNAAAIERGVSFFFYNDMTNSVASFLEKIDNERLLLAEAFGLKLHSVSDWISYAYTNIEGETLCEKMKNNKAYYKIKAPQKIDSRLLTEDIPTGILPFVELGKMCGLNLPLMNSILEISQALLGIDFRKTGRSLKNLNIDHLSKEEFLDSL